MPNRENEEDKSWNRELRPYGDEQQLIAYRGPLPPASEFERYEAAFPGAADRILSMAEEQARHRHSLERGDGRRAMLGLAMAFVIVLLGILGGFFLILNDKNAAGLAVVFGPIAAVAGVFVYQRRRRRSLEERH